ncbi:hypothetical protein FNH09_23505 [Streptomyces adustus]|uniref:Uncharacterized protein n=1 Tax=Streptomyces adustus TaxID=1609272 RepID=A0A5N8VJH1_9ACTN|nr:hypothetical protein [Streptomyces adustus]MPY34105.1 hypothetical protein [Streptomyces adustus]
MTTTDPETSTATACDIDVDAIRLSGLLIRSVEGQHRVAIQALVEERTILALPQVRTAIVAERRGRKACNWEGLTGMLYTLPLDRPQRIFLGLLLSMVGIGSTPLSAVADLDHERLRIFTQAILRLAGSDSIAIGTRL